MDEHVVEINQLTCMLVLVILRIDFLNVKKAYECQNRITALVFKVYTCTIEISTGIRYFEPLT